MTTPRVIVLVLLAAGILVLYYLGPLLSLFVGSALLAYLLLPPVDYLSRTLPRWLAVAAVFGLFIAILILAGMLLVPLIGEQIQVFLANWPRYQAILLERLNAIYLALGSPGSPEAILASLQGQVGKVGGWFATGLGHVWNSSMAFLAWTLNLVLVPVIAFYLLKDWHGILARIDELLPRPQAPRLRALFAETDQVLGEFLRGQLLVMLGLGSMYSLGLMILGLNLALPIGIFAGLVSFIPYLGLILGGGIALVMAALQFHDAIHPLWVLGIFAGAQLIESTLLTPWLVGDRIGIHPVGVIFAVLAGEQLYGVTGMLLALPLAAILTVWWRPVLGRYRLSRFYRGTGPAPTLAEPSPGDGAP
ncbi:AI-2E family transporter [Thermithiobacillus plumbiphilus]|uniref:AI-2E family transporter n=1 Tax=Thermithiobacillus plumbiphilus TaxID=1729899 RepID=A0ABU9D6F5_9PROT